MLVKGPRSHTSSNAQFTSSQLVLYMLLKGSRSHTSSNAQFTSSQLVLYMLLKGPHSHTSCLATEIEEESALDATSTRAAPGLLGSDVNPI
jgi:hypothetical protein